MCLYWPCLFLSVTLSFSLCHIYNYINIKVDIFIIIHIWMHTCIYMKKKMWESTSESWPSYLGIVGVFVSVATNYHKQGGLKQQKCVLSQFWRLDVQRCQAGWLSFQISRGEVFLASFSLWWLLAFPGLEQHSSRLSLLLHTAFSLYLCVFYKDTSHEI